MPQVVLTGMTPEHAAVYNALTPVINACGQPSHIVLDVLFNLYRMSILQFPDQYGCGALSCSTLAGELLTLQGEQMRRAAATPPVPDLPLAPGSTNTH